MIWERKGVHPCKRFLSPKRAKLGWPISGTKSIARFDQTFCIDASWSAIKPNEGIELSAAVQSNDSMLFPKNCLWLKIFTIPSTGEIMRDVWLYCPDGFYAWTMPCHKKSLFAIPETEVAPKLNYWTSAIWSLNNLVSTMTMLLTNCCCSQDWVVLVIWNY